MRAVDSVIQLLIIAPLAVGAIAWAAAVHRQSLRSARRVYHERYDEDADRRRRSHRAPARRPAGAGTASSGRRAIRRSS